MCSCYRRRCTVYKGTQTVEVIQDRLYGPRILVFGQSVECFTLTVGHGATGIIGRIRRLCGTVLAKPLKLVDKFVQYIKGPFGHKNPSSRGGRLVGDVVCHGDDLIKERAVNVPSVNVVAKTGTCVGEVMSMSEFLVQGQKKGVVVAFGGDCFGRWPCGFLKILRESVTRETRKIGKHYKNKINPRVYIRKAKTMQQISMH